MTRRRARRGGFPRNWFSDAFACQVAAKAAKAAKATNKKGRACETLTADATCDGYNAFI